MMILLKLLADADTGPEYIMKLCARQASSFFPFRKLLYELYSRSLGTLFGAIHGETLPVIVDLWTVGQMIVPQMQTVMTINRAYPL
jgi:hypothetical protein